jgi:hypothetical protein
MGNICALGEKKSALKIEPCTLGSKGKRRQGEKNVFPTPHCSGLPGNYFLCSVLCSNTFQDNLIFRETVKGITLL